MDTQQSLSTNQEMQPPLTSGGCGWRMLLYLAALVIAFAGGSWFTARTTPAPRSSHLITPKASFEKPVVVQISGSVKKPGVYELPFNARVYQAIDKAGGLMPDAETESINLADWVKDGSQIIVPAKSAIPAETAPVNVPSETPLLELEPSLMESPAPAKSTFAPKKETPPAKAATLKPRKSASKEPPQSPIDLNRATAEDLQQLPGVGPAMASRILEYRKENQGFTSVDDLDNVRGIGAKTLEKLRPFVLVKPLPFQKSSE